MAQSATEARRQRTQRDISRCARQLARERGLDGFTMDELAERVGVSRRTLFNYVLSKVDAVLGTGPEPAILDSFIEAGASGHLLTDVKELVCALMAAENADPKEVDETRQLLRSDLRLQAALHVKFVKVMEELADVLKRLGSSQADPLTVRVIAQLTVVLFDIALDESLADSSRTLAEHFRRVFDTTAHLFAPTL